jgi:hypothetical protein
VWICRSELFFAGIPGALRLLASGISTEEAKMEIAEAMK